MESAYLEFRTLGRRSQQRLRREPSLRNLQLATLGIACLTATPCLCPEALPASQFFSVEDEKN